MRHKQIQFVACTLAVALSLSAQSVYAQSADEEWFPWAVSVDLNDPTLSDSMTADEGFKKLKATDLWSPAGERLILEIVASEVFDGALKQYTEFVSTKPKDANVLATHGLLLTYAAYMSESETDFARHSTAADAAFDKAAQLDQNNWGAWIGKAVLYGYSEEKTYETAAVKMLVPTIQAQEQDRRQAKYATAYLVPRRRLHSAQRGRQSETNLGTRLASASPERGSKEQDHSQVMSAAQELRNQWTLTADSFASIGGAAKIMSEWARRLRQVSQAKWRTQHERLVFCRHRLFAVVAY